MSAAIRKDWDYVALTFVLGVYVTAAAAVAITLMLALSQTFLQIRQSQYPDNLIPGWAQDLGIWLRVEPAAPAPHKAALRPRDSVPREKSARR